MLTVVQYQQELLVPHVRDQQGGWISRCLVSQIQSREGGIGNQSRIPDFGEFDKPRAAFEAARQVGGDAYGKAALADTARPNEANKPGGGQLGSQFAKFAPAADEARCFRGQVAQPACGPSHDPQITTSARNALG